jgi:hypothetical protein
MSVVTSPYPWSTKVDAVTKYMSLGNMRLVSELTKVTYDTLCDWRKQEWWGQLVNEIRASQKAKTNKKLTEIIENSLDIVQDRLQNGDYILNQKTGEIDRKPIGIRDAANITNQLLTRQLQMEELAAKVDVQRDTVQETLKLLAKEFTKWNIKANNHTAIDVAYKELPNAIHEERTPRLQEGSSSLYEQTGSEEEEGGTERSSSDNGESWEST